MTDRAFAILSAVSLMLWVAVTALFVSSFSVGHAWTRSDWYGTNLTDRAVQCAWGQIRIHSVRWQSSYPQGIVGWDTGAKSGTVARFQGWRHSQQHIWWPGEDWYTVSYESGPYRGFDRDGMPRARGWKTSIRIPLWPLVLILPLLPTLWLRRFRRARRRLKLGLCPTCGYDLRATPDRCPECGTAVPADVQRKELP